MLSFNSTHKKAGKQLKPERLCDLAEVTQLVWPEVGQEPQSPVSFSFHCITLPCIFPWKFCYSKWSCGPARGPDLSVSK